MNESFELSDFEGVPEWARKSADRVTAQRPSTSVLDFRGQTAWPLLVRAATVSTFLPGDLVVPEPLPDEERRDAESTVLRFAEPSYEGETRKWSLTSDARKDVLSAITTSEIADIPAAKDDPLTIALREILRGKRKVGYESNDVRALEATRLAVSWLGDAKSLQPPLIEDLDRQIELRRLLSPFEHMVRLPGDGPEPPKDRFFGRTKEMAQLRKYVGVKPPSSLIGYALHAASNAYHSFVPRDPMCIWGTGGVGKTSLIARFMLEHAEVAQARFPFTYLDFDRPTLSSRDVLGLLGEMCRQVGAQFSELTEPMGELRAQLAELTRKFEKNPEEAMSIVGQFAQQFRGHVEAYLRASESMFEFARPFLLVFDTFEIVQYSADQVSGLEYFVRAFSLPNEPGLWPRLRLIISGRTKVEEFIVKIAKNDILELGALDREGSAEMLMAFAADAGKPLAENDALRLVDAIAKAVGDKPRSGVRPLRLRLIGTVFRDEKVSKDSGAVIVDKLIAELTDENPAEGEGFARHLFVDGILVRRILSHVKDRRVKALADPGLVVRRITPDVIRNVMTRGTANPEKVPNDVSDAPPTEPWIVTEGEARDIFDAFKREVSLVERYDLDDETALRHRQDVRRDMMPLIKGRRRNRFFALHQLAYDFFSNAARTNPDDAASAREALYHGLWLGRPFKELDALWRDDARIDPAEFDARSRVGLYLRLKSKKGGAKFSADEIADLPPEVALDWLASHSEELLKHRRLEETLTTIRAATGTRFEKLVGRDDLAAVVARLLYRGGLWHDAAVLLRQQFDGLASMPGHLPVAHMSLIRTWATIAGRSAAPPAEIEEIVPLVSRLQEPMARIEAAAHLKMGLRGNDLDQLNLQKPLRSLLDSPASRITPSRWSREPRILRLAILASPDARPLIHAYVSTTERLPRGPEVVRQLQTLSDNPYLTSIHQISREVGDSIDKIWRKERSRFLGMIERPEVVAAIRTIVAHDHSDWAQPLGNALTRSLAADPKFIQKAFKEFQKSPDAMRAMKRNDGASLVQLAMDEGRFLDVVRRLSDAPSATEHHTRGLVSPGVRELNWRYPDTTPELALALLAWHNAALSGPEPDADLAHAW